MARLSTLTNFCYVLLALTCVYQIRAATIRSQKDALTFKWYDDVIAEKVKIFENDKCSQQTRHLAECSELYGEIRAISTLEATNFTSEFPDSIAWSASAGFVDTVFYSYQKHHNLIIRPDDVWTAILVQFSLYVNANAEDLRNLFVNFKGQKELEVKFTVPVDDVPIDEFITKIVSLITENIDRSMYHWISPNFTTTTENDKLTAGALLMATVQNYFNFNMMSILCGIPQVTILGTLDDWKEIRTRVDKLNEFELKGKNVMKKWSSMLGRILDKFVSVKQGNDPDNVFWKQAIRVDYKMVDLVCAEVKQTYLNGWITAFSAFDQQGNWQGDFGNYQEKANVTQWFSIPTDSITKGIVHVPIKIYDEHNTPEERSYDGAIITGHMGHSVKQDEKTIQPLSGWAMVVATHLPQ